MKQQGFTLMEMMLAVSIFAILTMLAVPSFRDAAGRAALRSATTDMVVAINTSRAQAVANRQDIQLRSTDNADWGKGWTIDYPTTVKEKDQGFVPKDFITVVETGGNQQVVFRKNGLLSSEMTFNICNPNMAGKPGRQISVTRAGRLTNVEFGGC